MIPKYREAINIRCIAPGCKQIVRHDGIPVVNCTELRHRFGAGEKAYLCRRCARSAWKNRSVLFPVGPWERVKDIEVVPFVE